ncbi:glycosyltransferase [Acidithiobacillus albertensis]|uniref:glycosyltransferase n=1 Tax=Acidithiobacillus albertensis TaxID=119978 RepID=UPI00094ABE74|nr:glycosyltransferase [Acidithiobacillus albertensis]
MTAKPRISIAMATYNGAQYIREQLDSLAAQTLLPCELVVTDDGSTDATLEIVRDFAREAPFPVRIYCNENRLGYADNFLYAASSCEGDLIAFCDQDDVWMMEKLATCVQAFTDQDVLLVIHAAQVTGPDLTLTGTLFPDIKQVNRRLAKRLKQADILPHDQIIRRIYKPLQLDPMNIYPGFSMVFRKMVVNFIDRPDRGKDYRFYSSNPPMIPHDRWIYLLCCSLGKVVLTEEHLSLYRQHDSNTCGLSGPPLLINSLTSYFAATIFEGRYRNEQHWAGIMEKISRNYSGQNEYIANNASQAKRYFEMNGNNDRALTDIYSVKSDFTKRLFGYTDLMRNAYRNPACLQFGGFHPVREFVFGVLGCYLLYRKTKMVLLRVKKSIAIRI